MVNILNKIIEEKKSTLINLKNKYSFSSILEKIKENKNNLNFIEKINKNIKLNKISVIAEIKKASPSAGLIIEKYKSVSLKFYKTVFLITVTSPAKVSHPEVWPRSLIFSTAKLIWVTSPFMRALSNL